VQRILLAIVVALAVPVAQLQTNAVVTTCCCPDPGRCHCPDHKADHGDGPSLRACHRTSQDLVRSQLPVFTPPLDRADPSEQPVVAAVVPIASPHPAPPPARPAAPS
jgi:hypothetical protein